MAMATDLIVSAITILQLLLLLSMIHTLVCDQFVFAFILLLHFLSHHVVCVHVVILLIIAAVVFVITESNKVSFSCLHGLGLSICTMCDCLGGESLDIETQTVWILRVYSLFEQSNSQTLRQSTM